MDYQLPKKFKAKWIEGLRSEEYYQTTGVLYEPSPNNETDCVGYCALGVAIAHSTDTHIEMYDGDSRWDSTYKLPIDNTYFYGKDIDKQIMFGKLQDKVIELNDTDCLSFDEIAEWIENNVEGV
tara:strand:+ start:2946 stop:3317 length:372 start_codon:yes stop_codon:yes gene_type:complete